MSWREREFNHESEAYFRSIDQIDVGGSVGVAMGCHIEAGKSVVDWFKVEHAGRKVRVNLFYPALCDCVVAHIEGRDETMRLPVSKQDALTAARELALKILKGENDQG